MASSSEEEPQVRPQRKRRTSSNSNDFRVKILEFEAKLDPNEFLEWLHIAEWIFDYEEVLKKQESQASWSQLRKYTSL